MLDNGSGTIKCGIAGMSEPLGFLPTVVGRPLYRSVLPMMDAGRVYVGEEAKKKKGVLSLEYPIEHGMVTNWGDMESVWHHTFYNELRIDPCVRPVVLAEHVLAPHETREKAAEIMFEKFGVPAFFAASQAALALHSLGLTTGLVADVGAGTVQTAAVVRGEVLGYAARRSEYGGRECADLFVSSLAKDGAFLGDTSSERDIARLMMESVGYVAEDYDAEMRRPRADVTVTYTLPDGTVAHPAQARFVCAEPLFRPTLVGKDTLSLPQMAATSILQAPEDARTELARNVVLIGGASLFRGLPERLLRELRAILPKSVAPDKLVLPQERSWAAWLGGSMIGSNVDEYSYLCVTKAEYDESGPLALSFMK